MKESFEPLAKYNPDNNKVFVNESLLLEKDDDGVIGSIIDKGLSFVPRAMRFKKAKKVMKKSLAQYTKKSKNLISKFAKGLSKKVGVIEKEYQELLNKKIKPLVEKGEEDKAVTLLKDQLEEIKEYRKEQMQVLENGIKDILNAYSTSIERRIENPGFILNVELSEKGKGELKAKWQELVSIQNIKIEEYKTNVLVKSEAFKKLDEVISEMTSFIERKKGVGSEDISIFIQDIINKGDNEFLVHTHIRVSGGRPKLEEKGLIVGDSPDELSMQEGARRIKVTGTYQYSLNPYKLIIRADEDQYVRPYMKLKGKDKPIYGDIASLDIRQKTRKERQMGDVRYTEKPQAGDIEAEKDIIPPEGK